MNNITIEKIDIPIKEDNISLKGSIYYSPNTPSKAPFIINSPAFRESRDSNFVKFYNEGFSDAGYYVLTYDHRAHGETAHQTGSNWLKYIPKIFSDLQKVITWIFESQKQRLLNDNIILFGRSIGGAIMLTYGYLDARAKIIFALCTRYDYSTVPNFTFSPENVKLMSPKYYLKNLPSNNDRIFIAHCKDDEVIPFDNFIKIKNHLYLNDTNTLEFEIGGHSFKGHRDEILSYALKVLKKL
jgi:predicted esterase